MTKFTITEDFPENEIEFDQRFSDPKACYQYLFKQKWPDEALAAMEQLGPGCKNSDDALYARDVVNYPGVLKWMNFSLVAKNLVKEVVAPRAKQSWLLLWIIHSSSILLATTA